jgi:hypothetical protein
MEVSGQLHAPAALPPGTGVWVGPRASLNAAEKRQISCPCRESNPGRAARSYTDCAIPAPKGCAVNGVINFPYSEPYELIKRKCIATIMKFFPPRHCRSEPRNIHVMGLYCKYRLPALLSISSVDIKNDRTNFNGYKMYV